MVSKKTGRGQCVAGRNGKNVKLVKEKNMKTKEKEQIINVNKTKIKGAKKMKYKVKLFYPENLVDYETGLEVEHHEIGWSWHNGPAIEVDHCIMSVTGADDSQNFVILPYSPIGSIDLTNIIFYFSLNKNYNDTDIFCFGNEEMSIKEVFDKMNASIANGAEDVD